MSDNHTAQAAPCFVYEAQSRDGQTITGTIDAADVHEARWKLQTLGVRVLDLAPGKPRRPAAPQREATGGRVRSEDFVAFNQQLAQLTKAGLPLERGLRLIGRDMRSGRLRRAIGQIADDLEAGQPLDEAFDKHRGRFPAMYGRLIDAGVRSGNLSAVLLNLASHLELGARLRAAIWQAISYPLVVLAAMALVLCFVGYVVVPPMQAMIEGFTEQADFMGTHRPRTPVLAAMLFVVSRHMPMLVLLAAAGGIAAWAAWRWQRRAGREQWLVEQWIMPLPLIGPVLVKDRIARWCDALRIAIDAGLDLPGAIELAGQATRSPRLIEDGAKLIAALHNGQSLEEAARTKLVPASVQVAIDLGAARGDLSRTLATLTELHRQQADHRIDLMAAVLQPALVVVLGLVAGLMMGGLYSMITSFLDHGPGMIQSVMS